MSCNRPIAPHLKDRIKEVEWEDLDPDQYPHLLRAIYISDEPPRTVEEIQSDLRYIRENIIRKAKVFRRARLSLVGRTQVQVYRADPEPYWIVQYGVNDISPNNPEEVWRCKPKRGGGRDSNLQLYIVSEAKQKLTKGLFVSASHPSREGQHLRIINNRLFVKNIYPEGQIELNEIDIDLADGETVCDFQFRKSK